MIKNDCLKSVEKFKLNIKTKILLRGQIELFYQYNGNINKTHFHNDEVVLSQSNLIHGTRADLKVLEIIASNGLIASEFYDSFNSNKKKPYVVELWSINEKIKLSDWIKKYAGVTIDFKNREGVVYKSVISEFDNIKKNIQKESGFRDYIIYQNQEQRFVPNDLVENESTVAFIIEFDKNDKLIKNDILNKSFDDEIVKDILPEWFYEKYIKNRNFDNYETGREKAVLFGIPVVMIKGIMISRKIEKDISSINRIKKLFPNCYICNIDGKVIL